MKKLLVTALGLFVCCFCLTGPVIAGDEEAGEVKWTDRITISGLLEAELGIADMDFADPAQEDEDSSDIVLATAELAIDAELHKHASGHILFLFEEDENDDNIAVDEAFISLNGADVIPLYLNAGRLYVPFGQFESHMITDPLTLDFGETSESAVQIGFANDFIDASLAIYNGDVDETGDDDHVSSYAAGIVFTLPEDSVPNLGLAAGVSYISNIGDTDTIEGEVDTADGTLADSVAGMGAFVSASFKDFLFLEVEYITALDDFLVGELTFNSTAEVSPNALNVEVAVAPTEDMEIALRYGSTDDFNGALPETQYGIAIAYGIFEDTTIAAEYLMNEYENDDENSVITIQLGYEF